MKINYILFIPILFFVATTNAQFTDDMESYIDGEPIIGGHWTDWGCGGGVGCALMSTSAQAHTSGVLSGLIPGDETTDAVLDLGNKIFGEWGLEFWVYIPSGKEGAINIQNEVPIGAGQSVVGDILFNPNLESPGIGKITDSAIGEVLFNFPHDEWFRVVMNWDISLGIAAATWHFYLDGDYVLPIGTPYTNEIGEPAASLGGIEFFSVSTNNEMYVDTFVFQNDGIVCDLGINSFSESKIILHPNPAKEVIHISSKATIKSLRIYNALGNIIMETSGLNSIDISNLSSGFYFIEVSTDTGSSIQKFIKN